jgi:hypothetical protein
MDRLEELGHMYDSLTTQRRRWINEYDVAQDGSKRKMKALKQLATLGREIRAVEDEIGEIVDRMEEEAE